MKIKDIVRYSALILGRSDVINYLDGKENTGVDTAETVNLLTNLCTLVVEELASTYLPLVSKSTVTFVNGRQPLNQLNDKIVKIVAVYDINGNPIDFTVDNHYVNAQITKCTVEFLYLPKNYGLEDNVGYSEKDISATTLAYGVVAEYCITQGLFEQAVMHHKRYVDAVAEICMPKNKKIKARSWV